MSDPNATEWMIFNGLDATTGDYLTITTAKDLARLAVEADTARYQQPQNPDELDDPDLQELRSKSTQAEDMWVNVDNLRDLSQTGWCALFAYNADERIQAALAPLLTHRRDQAGPLFKLFTGRDGYHPGEKKHRFVGRHEAPQDGPVDPERIPYYVLLVGSPQEIPFEFQYQMGVQYAIGRIYFETLSEYASYARSVVQAERDMPPLPRQATFFSVSHQGDPATRDSTNHLVKPLALSALPAMFAKTVEHETRKAAHNRTQGRHDAAQGNEDLAQDAGEWVISSLLEEEAHKDNLRRVLGGNDTPAFLFTASHGIGFPNGHELQLSDQGALVCQDWPGPASPRPAGVEGVPRDYYFGGHDMGDDVNLLGTIAFFFACFGGGTPRFDEFSQHLKGASEIAPHPFLARLPQRMLGHPAGGALAVVSHVERAWGYSFMYERTPQINTFEATLQQLLSWKYPLGAAMEGFSLRYAEIATRLTEEMFPHRMFGYKLRESVMARLWTTHNDARSYVILGDPAVYVRVAGPGSNRATRPTLEPVAALPTGERDLVIQHPEAAVEALSAAEVAGDNEPAPDAPHFSAGAVSEPPPAAPGSPPAVTINRAAVQAATQEQVGLAGAAAVVARSTAEAIRQVLDEPRLDAAVYAPDEDSGVTYNHKTGTYANTMRLLALAAPSADAHTAPGEQAQQVWDVQVTVQVRPLTGGNAGDSPDTPAP